MPDPSPLQNPHVPPFVSELRNTLPQPLRGHQILHDQQLELLSEREEVGEQAVEVGFDGEVEDLLKVRVIQVGENAEEVFVDVFGGMCEG